MFTCVQDLTCIRRIFLHSAALRMSILAVKSRGRRQWTAVLPGRQRGLYEGLRTAVPRSLWHRAHRTAQRRGFGIHLETVRRIALVRDPTAMSKLCILNVVGLTPEMAAHAPQLSALGTAQPWRSPLPAVHAQSQATMVNGLAPREHGIVGNGWYFREDRRSPLLATVYRLIQGPSSTKASKPPNSFGGSIRGSVKWFATPNRITDATVPKRSVFSTKPNAI